MPRSKQYVEKDVIEKATDLFWRLGYTNSSMRLLEEAMGINKFSIYSSFGSKEGVFIKCLECYSQKMKVITNKMTETNTGIPCIKQFFYDFLEFSTNEETSKGCLIASTASELGLKGNPNILEYIETCSDSLKSKFKAQLALNTSKSDELLETQANYLLVTNLGLCNATKIFSPQIISDYIEITFLNLK